MVGGGVSAAFAVKARGKSSAALSVFTHAKVSGLAVTSLPNSSLGVFGKLRVPEDSLLESRALFLRDIHGH